MTQYIVVDPRDMPILGRHTTAFFDSDINQRKTDRHKAARVEIVDKKRSYKPAPPPA